MNDFRHLALEALEEIGHDAAVARVRRRVAARLEAGEVASSTWFRRWAPVLATVAFAASAALSYAVISDPQPEVVAVPTPEEEPEEFPADDAPGFAPKPELPPVERMPTPEAPRFDDEDDEKRTGTLVAIAIGGRCAFSVDGEPKGTSSSIRIQVPLGEHVVGCSVSARNRDSRRCG